MQFLDSMGELLEKTILSVDSDWLEAQCVKLTWFSIYFGAAFMVLVGLVWIRKWVTDYIIKEKRRVDRLSTKVENGNVTDYRIPRARVPLNYQILQTRLRQTGDKIDWENYRKIHKVLMLFGMSEDEKCKGLWFPFVGSQYYKPSPTYLFVKTMNDFCHFTSAKLCNQKVIAVDIKNCDDSYEGFISFLSFSFYDDDIKVIKTFVFDMIEIMADSKSENNVYANKMWQDMCQDFLGSMLFENSEITKIFYGSLTHGSNDGPLAWIQRDYGVKCKNVFDVRDYYQAINDKMLKTKRNLDIHLSLPQIWNYCNCKPEEGDMFIDNDKKREMDKTNWSKRPITDEMIDFIAHDVHFLISATYSMFRKKIDEDAIKEIAERAEEIDYKPRSFLKPIGVAYNQMKRYYIDKFDPKNDDHIYTWYMTEQIIEKFIEIKAQKNDLNIKQVCPDLMIICKIASRAKQLKKQGTDTPINFENLTKTLNEKQGDVEQKFIENLELDDHKKLVVAVKSSASRYEKLEHSTRMRQYIADLIDKK